MTIEELASQAGLTPTTVTKLELGYKSPRAESLVALAKVLGCTPNDLMPSTLGTKKGALIAEINLYLYEMTNSDLKELLNSFGG